jgi:hypothetical protein
MKGIQTGAPAYYFGPQLSPSSNPPNGQLWWTSIATTNLSGTVNNAKDFYLTQLLAPYQLAVANQGKPRSQVREWRSNALTNYTFSEGKLKGLGVGGAVRWQDKAAIGFLGAAPESDGVVRSLDANKPVYDRARFAVDFRRAMGSVSSANACAPRCSSTFGTHLKTAICKKSPSTQTALPTRTVSSTHGSLF